MISKKPFIKQDEFILFSILFNTDNKRLTSIYDDEGLKKFFSLDKINYDSLFQYIPEDEIQNLIGFFNNIGSDNGADEIKFTF